MLLLLPAGLILILGVIGKLLLPLNANGCWSNDDADGDKPAASFFNDENVSLSSSSSNRISFVASKLALISFFLMLNISSISSICLLLFLKE